MIKNFSLQEFLYSNTGILNNIQNIPITAETTNNCFKTLEKLQRIRTVYGKEIKITSGYRNEKINKMVGGSKNSLHIKGLAVDIKALSQRTEDKELLESICIMLKNSKQIKELIIHNTYIHIGFYE